VITMSDAATRGGIGMTTIVLRMGVGLRDRGDGNCCSCGGDGVIVGMRMMQGCRWSGRLWDAGRTVPMVAVGRACSQSFGNLDSGDGRSMLVMVVMVAGMGGSL